MKLGKLELGKRGMRYESQWQSAISDDGENKETDNSEEETASPCCNQGETQTEIMSKAPQTLTEEASSSGVGASQEFQQIGPSKQSNQIIALASVLVAVGLFTSGRLETLVGPGLNQLTANAIPYEEALVNGRPTVVEFYADWCEVCREMAKEVYRVEEEYKDRINFVMLNVDNSKWEPELDEFGVEGIPHFAFLDRKGNEEGNIVGRLPKKYLIENVMALVRGDSSIPHSSVVGSYSSADSRTAPPVVGPRSHSQS